jgi:hypothetical protein
MKQVKVHIVIFLLIVAGFASCKDRSDEFTPGLNSYDTTWVAQLPCTAKVLELLDEIQLTTRKDSFNTGQSVILFYRANGAEIGQLRVPPTTRWRKVSDSSLVTGQVFVEAKVTNSMGGMLQENLFDNLGGNLFFAALSFKINNAEVVPAPDSLGNRAELLMRTRNYGIGVTEQKGTKDACQKNTNFNIGGGNVPPIPWVDAGTQTFNGYKVPLIGDRKSSMLKTINLPGTRRRMNVLLPLGFTNTNSKVYYVDSVARTIVGFEFDYQNKLFFTNAYAAGMQQKSILVVSKQLQQRFYGRADLTNDTTTVVRLNPQPISNDNLIVELSRF